MFSYLTKLALIFLIAFWTQNSFATCVGLGCSCSISATNASFGGYDPLSVTPDDTTSTISVTCGALVLGGLIAYTIRLSKGSSATYTPRTMLSGANILNYNLYTDAARTQIWGDTTGGTVEVSDSYLLSILSTTRNYTAFGRIPASQNVPAGSYSDSIVATVTY